MCSFSDITWICQLRDWINSPFVIALMACMLGYIAYIHARREHPTYDDEDYEKEGHVMLRAPLRNLKLTKEELKTYDSQNPRGIYLVCLLGKLYDVSCSPKDFGPNGSYKELTGTDIMWYIKKTVRYEIRSLDAYIEEYKNRLEDRFFVAGILLDDKKQNEEKEEKTPVAESGSALSSDSGWDTVNESSIEFEFKEVEVEGDKNENQPEKVEDIEETLITSKGEETQLTQNFNRTI